MSVVPTVVSPFGSNLRRLREARGLTRYRLAKLAGVSETAVNRYETGERASPNSLQVTRLADVLDVTIDDLLRGEPAEVA